MDELADDTIEGRCCSNCGAYFEEEHGFPVLCEYCYEEHMRSLSEDSDVEFPLATYRELGV